MCVLGIMNEMVKECENFESDRHLLATSVRFFVDLDLLLHRREEMKETLELLLLNECLGASRLEYLINEFTEEVNDLEHILADLTEEYIDAKLHFSLLIRTLQCTTRFFETVLNMFNNSQQTNH
jgi:hypothetical protein